jgi:hypothetical protein
VTDSAKTWAGVGAVLALFVGAVIGAYYFGRSNALKDVQLAKPDTVTVVEVLKVEVPKYIYRTLPAKVETVYVEQVPEIIATVDTVFLPSQDSLSLAYFYSSQRFAMDFRPGPIRTEYKKEFITKTVVEYYPDLAWTIGGTAGGFILGLLVKK